MKKMLSVFVLTLTLVASGCVFGKTGEYEFDSVIVLESGEEKTYKCNGDESGNSYATSRCSLGKHLSYEIKQGGVFLWKQDGKTLYETYYKVEGDVLYVSETKDGEYNKYGEYKKGKIIVFHDGYKLVFKK